jgi:ComEC/Rec2-related protein
MEALTPVIIKLLEQFQKHQFIISFYSSTIAFAGGIFFGEHYFQQAALHTLYALSLYLAYTGYASSRKSTSTICFTLSFSVLFFSIGYLSMGSHIQSLESESINCSGTCTLSLKIIKAPEHHERFTRLTAATPTGIQVEILTGHSIPFAYNDHLSVTGTYTSLKEKARGDSVYAQQDRARYLEGTQYSVMYPNIERIDSGQGGVVGLFYTFRKHIQDTLAQLIPSPENSLVLGMVLGDKTHLPKDLSENLSRTGIMHIIVVSGYNISLIINLTLHVLRRTSRRLRFTTTFTTLTLFVTLVGFEPSVLRAAGMASVLLIGKILFKPIAQLRTLIAVAVGMVLISPHLLFHSISFQFSFCATLGLLLFSDFFNSLFSRIRLVFVREILAQSCASQVLITPLILFYMQSVSLVSPLTNLLVLPLVPFITVVGGITVMISFLSTPAALLLGYILYIPTHYIVFISERIGTWSFVTFESTTFGIPILIALYICITILALKGREIMKTKNSLKGSLGGTQR